MALFEQRVAGKRVSIFAAGVGAVVGGVVGVALGILSQNVAAGHVGGLLVLGIAIAAAQQRRGKADLSQ